MEGLPPFLSCLGCSSTCFSHVPPSSRGKLCRARVRAGDQPPHESRGARNATASPASRVPLKSQTKPNDLSNSYYQENVTRRAPCYALTQTRSFPRKYRKLCSELGKIQSDNCPCCSFHLPRLHLWLFQTW